MEELRAPRRSLTRSRKFQAEDLSVHVVQLHRQRLRAAIDAAAAEELIRLARRPVRLHAARDAQEPHLGPERPIERARAKRAGVQRARHEFPERIALSEARACRA